MTNSQRLATVRDRLIRWLANRNAASSTPGGEPPAAAIVSESILIRDGYYVGRRFNLGSYRAVWFLEEDELKLYHASGELACVLTGEGIDQVNGSAEVLSMPEPQPPQGDDQPDDVRRAA